MGREASPDPLQFKTKKIMAKFETIASNIVPVLVGICLVVIVVVAVIKWQSRPGKTPALV